MPDLYDTMHDDQDSRESLGLEAAALARQAMQTLDLDTWLALPDAERQAALADALREAVEHGLGEITAAAESAAREGAAEMMR